MINLYYQFPISLAKFCGKIHFKKLRNLVLRTCLGMNTNDLNKDMFDFIIDLLEKQLDIIDKKNY